MPCAFLKGMTMFSIRDDLAEGCSDIYKQYFSMALCHGVIMLELCA